MTEFIRPEQKMCGAHTIDTKCAACHRKIDPIGFVLENFDPPRTMAHPLPGVDEE